MPNYRIGVEVDANTGDSAKEIKGVGSAVDSLDDAFGGGIKNTSAFGLSLGDLLSPAGLATGAITAIGGAMIATGAHAMALATEVEGATALMSTQLGLTTDEAQGFEDTMRSIYTNNYAEGFTDIAAAMVSTEQQMQRLGGSESQAQLQEMTQLAIAYADAFDKDVNESVGAAVTLMDVMGVSGTEAFDALTFAQQKGLDASGDLIDNMGEYLVQVKQAGGDTATFLSILETGYAGGVLGGEKALDAFKEFNIRIMDNSKLTEDSLASLGISYDELKQGFADGSITQAQAFQTVIDKAKEVEDPLQRNIALVGLMGTQAEDLTETMLTEIDLQKTAVEDLEGAHASLEEQYKTSGAAGAEAMREWNNALVDVGEELNALKEAALPAFTWAIQNVAIPAMSDLTQWFEDARATMDLLGDAMEFYWRLFKGESVDDILTSPDAGASSLSVATPAMAVASSAGMGGGGINQHFYIERGDPETVREAASLGIGQAQRARGW